MKKLTKKEKILQILNTVHEYLYKNAVQELEHLKIVSTAVTEYYGKGFGFGVDLELIDESRPDKSSVSMSTTLNDGKYTSALFYLDDGESIKCEKLQTLTEYVKTKLAEKGVIQASIEPLAKE